MSKLNAFLTIATICLMGNVAQAQHCSDGACSVRPQNTRSGGLNRSFTKYESPLGYGNTCSFSEVCRDCGSAQGVSHQDSFYDNQRDYTRYRDSERVGQYGSEADYRLRDPRSGGARSNDFQRRTNFGSQADFDLRSRDGYDARQGWGSDYRTRNDFDRFESRYRDFDRPGLNQRRYDNRDYRFQNDDRGLRFPSDARSRTQYNYTSTQSPNIIRWQSDLQEAATQAKAQGRPMIVTIGANWCSYCQRMKAEVFREGRFIQSVNRGRFVPVMLDADKSQSIVSRLGVRSLPTTFVVAPSMQILERMEGFRTTDQLTQSLNRHGRSVKKDSKIRVASN